MHISLYPGCSKKQSNMEVIQKQIQSATMELLELAKVSKGAILIVGCSSSEVTGHKIG